MFDPFYMRLTNMNMNKNRKNMLIPNPFLNRTFSIGGNNLYSFEDEEDEEISSLKTGNNFLMNYGDMRRNEMIEEKESFNRLYNISNKLQTLKNLKEEEEKKFSNKIDKYKRKEKAQIEQHLSDINDILDKSKNELLKKENYSKALDKRIENKKEIIKKKKEMKLAKKREMQKKLLNEMRNNKKIELKKYEKNKIIEKEKKQKEFELEKNQFKIDTKLKLNKIKMKADIARKLTYYFENTK